jgi:hypothetical protein
MEGMWRQLAKDAGLQPLEGGRLRNLFEQQTRNVEKHYLDKLNELQESLDVAERQLELLKKEQDILYEKYVEEKAQRILYDRLTSSQSHEDASGGPAQREEGVDTHEGTQSS